MRVCCIGGRVLLKCVQKGTRSDAELSQIKSRVRSTWDDGIICRAAGWTLTTDWYFEDLLAIVEFNFACICFSNRSDTNILVNASVAFMSFNVPLPCIVPG
jgi:hypothetical protein